MSNKLLENKKSFLEMKVIKNSLQTKEIITINRTNSRNLHTLEDHLNSNNN